MGVVAMITADLEYKNLKPKLSSLEAKGRGESAAFLGWFLENIYRLDEVAADDAICDKPNDKGIDGVYVDHNGEEIHFLQAKLVQSSEKTIGDVPLKNLMGSLAQFESKGSIEAILKSSANPDLKKALERQHIATLLEKGYRPIGVLVCNQDRDTNTDEILQHTNSVRLYDRARIAQEFVDFDAKEGVSEEFEFDATYVTPLQYQVESDKTIFLLPVEAGELVKLSGIGDTSLFSQNVRLSLGNTVVNKSISASVANAAEHKYFPLYHNGVTLLCEKASLKDGKLTIKNYVVVNGAQSISTFYKSADKLTSALRVFLKVIVLRDETLSRKITINSNNQNSIKPRDLRSNHDLMRRLRSEFESLASSYAFEIKRGEKFDDGKCVISNEEAGRLLLAFDLGEPYSCHQIYKVFDEKYSDIFGRPEVTAARIIFLFRAMEIISSEMENVKNSQLGHYRLTRYLLLDVVSHVLRQFSGTKSILAAKKGLDGPKNSKAILDALPELIGSLTVDFNYEVAEEDDSFDYKKDFKSPERVKVWRDRLLRSFEKDSKRGKTVDLSQIGLD